MMELDGAEKLVLLAVLVQVALTIWAIVAMGLARVRALKLRQVAIGDIALSTDAYSDDIKKLQNNVRNQFETPVLFYVAAVLALAMDAATPLVAGLSGLFVLSRLVHRRIHTGSNRLQHRFNAFLAGLVVLALLWIVLGAVLLVR